MGPTGALLVNLGTPAAPTTAAVRRYLREFLSDPRVIDSHPLARWLLVNLVVAPFRAPRSAAAYQKIWSRAGSPLRVHGRALAEGVARELGDGFAVELGMRYGQPSIAVAIDRLRAAGVERLIALPLFPQYSSAATGSAVARIEEVMAAQPDAPPLEIAPAFYDDPGFIEAFAAGAREPLAAFGADFALMSFHGLPERQIRKTDPTGAHCLESETCCDAIAAASSNRDCYRAQCFATARALAIALDLPSERLGVSFQSRLGRTPWIRPFTDEVLPQLAERGLKRLAIFCPAFVADCLETLEEIGIRARAQWSELGGDELWLAPCPNAHPVWLRAVADRVRRLGSPGARG
ncbi:MAG: ferrochelatase [Proteobacteria bacterium]|nr:ferrochelatase [Pseudomonadota bacterium]